MIENRTKDIFHSSVRQSLVKDGWQITHDPLLLFQKDLKMDYEIDLGAERLLGAEKGTEKIAVEVKSFLKTSLLHEFHGILGQYLVYRAGLLHLSPERQLFLAIPQFADLRLGEYPFLQELIGQYRIKIVVFDENTETILEWKS